jgi:hypothetical protein
LFADRELDVVLGEPHARGKMRLRRIASGKRLHVIACEPNEARMVAVGRDHRAPFSRRLSGGRTRKDQRCKNTSQEGN